MYDIPRHDPPADPHLTLRVAIDRCHEQGDYTRAELRTGRPYLVELELMQGEWEAEYPNIAEAIALLEGMMERGERIGRMTALIDTTGLSESQINLLYLHDDDSRQVREMMRDRLLKINRMQLGLDRRATAAEIQAAMDQG